MAWQGGARRRAPAASSPAQQWGVTHVPCALHTGHRSDGCRGKESYRGPDGGPNSPIRILTNVSIAAFAWSSGAVADGRAWRSATHPLR
jgi:hypothetical protein